MDVQMQKAEMRVPYMIVHEIPDGSGGLHLEDWDEPCWLNEGNAPNPLRAFNFHGASELSAFYKDHVAHLLDVMENHHPHIDGPTPFRESGPSLFLNTWKVPLTRNRLSPTVEDTCTLVGSIVEFYFSDLFDPTIMVSWPPIHDKLWVFERYFYIIPLHPIDPTQLAEVHASVETLFPENRGQLIQKAFLERRRLAGSGYHLDHWIYPLTEKQTSLLKSLTSPAIAPRTETYRQFPPPIRLGAMRLKDIHIDITRQPSKPFRGLNCFKSKKSQTKSQASSSRHRFPRLNNTRAFNPPGPPSLHKFQRASYLDSFYDGHIMQVSDALEDHKPHLSAPERCYRDLVWPRTFSHILEVPMAGEPCTLIGSIIEYYLTDIYDPSESLHGWPPTIANLPPLSRFYVLLPRPGQSINPNSINEVHRFLNLLFPDFADDIIFKRFLREKDCPLTHWIVPLTFDQANVLRSQTAPLPVSDDYVIPDRPWALKQWD